MRLGISTSQSRMKASEMMELRTINPNEVGVISLDDLEWIGASKVEPECYGCGRNDAPMYFFWEELHNEYCGACLVLEWSNHNDESE